MNTLDLNEAASFLKMNPEVLRRKARAGQVPGRKAGKCWIFVKEHLADWVSGRYSEPRHLSRPGFAAQDFGVHFKKAGGFI